MSCLLCALSIYVERFWFGWSSVIIKQRQFIQLNSIAKHCQWAHDRLQLWNSFANRIETLVIHQCNDINYKNRAWNSERIVIKYANTHRATHTHHQNNEYYVLQDDDSMCTHCGSKRPTFSDEIRLFIWTTIGAERAKEKCEITTNFLSNKSNSRARTVDTCVKSEKLFVVRREKNTNQPKDTVLKRDCPWVHAHAQAQQCEFVRARRISLSSLYVEP